MIYTMLSAVIQICDIQFDHDQETGGSYIADEYVLKVGKWAWCLKLHLASATGRTMNMMKEVLEERGF